LFQGAKTLGGHACVLLQDIEVESNLIMSLIASIPLYRHKA
jgi:hypothetical protein